MNKDQHPADTLNEIKVLMERSSKFISLSGLSGIIIGIITILSVTWFCDHYAINPFDPNLGQLSNLPSQHYSTAFILSLVLLTVSLFTTTLLSVQRARKMGMQVWGPASRQLMVNMLVPLSSGIVFCAILFFRTPDLVLPLSLIFYGISLYGAAKFTHNSVRVFGIIQILLGLICLLFIEYHIIIWTIGFGICHVIYGAFMTIKNE